MAGVVRGRRPAPEARRIRGECRVCGLTWAEIGPGEDSVGHSWPGRPSVRYSAMPREAIMGGLPDLRVDVGNFGPAEAMPLT